MTKVGDVIHLDDGLYEVIDRWPQMVERQNEKGDTVYVVRSYGLAARRVGVSGSPVPTVPEKR